MRSVPSSVSTSIWPLRGKRSGLFRVKVKSDERGRSSWLDRLMLAVFASAMDDLRNSVMTGRGADTTSGTESTRPSRSSTAAVRFSLTCVGGTGALAGRAKWSVPVAEESGVGVS